MDNSTEHIDENLNINSNEISDINSSVSESSENSKNADIPEIDELDSESSYANTAMIEYREIEEPCVALTIIGENRLTNAEVFVKRGFKFSIKAFFSTLILTVFNMII